jgi:hypothetical protein
MNQTRLLEKNLYSLIQLEVELKQQYDDEELFNEINFYKKSLSFFLESKDYKRSLYESNKLVSFIVSYLTD